MVMIPRTESRNSIRPTRPSLRSAGASGDRSLSIIGDALAKVGEKFNQVRDLNESVNASTALNEKLFEISKQAEEDQDVFNLEDKYNPMIDAAVAEAGNGITRSDARSRFSLQAGQSGLAMKVGLRQSARLRQAQRTRADIMTSNDANMKILHASTNPLTRQQLRDGMFGAIDQAEINGVYSAEEAAKLRKALDIEIRVGQVQHDMAADPISTVEALKDPKNYPDLTPQERASVTDDARDLMKKEIAQQKLEIAFKTGQMDQEVAQKLIDNELSLEELQNLFITTVGGLPGGISPELFAAGQSKIKSSDSVDSIPKFERFAELAGQFEMIAVASDEETLGKADTLALIADFRVNVIKSVARGDVSEAQARKWIQFVQPFYEQSMDAQARENFKKRNGTWRTVTNAINVFVDEFRAEGGEQMKMYLGEEVQARLLAGQADAQTIIDDIMAREQARVNPNRTLYPIGKEVVVDGVSGKVIGYEFDGEPMVHWE